MTILTNQMAHDDFEQARRRASWRDRLSRLTRKSNDLLSFEKIRQYLPITGTHDGGLQIVAIDKIVGSTNRYRDFDRAFFPRQTFTRHRWVSIDKAHYEDVILPPVELIKIGESYFVSDGNHRVSVARIRGQKFIDAHVIEIETTVPGDDVLVKKASIQSFWNALWSAFWPRSGCVHPVQ